MEVLFNRSLIEPSLHYGKFSGQEINISLDTSKTNTGICVMDRLYRPVGVYEAVAKHDKDVLIATMQQREYFRQIFKGAIVKDVGIEDIITTSRDKDGKDYHHSRFVITAVFMSFINLFQDSFGITPQLISNSTWKAVVLPEELNKKGVYKGSVPYIKTKYPQWIVGTKDDDICDAICIGEFMRIKAGVKEETMAIILPSEREPKKTDFKYAIFNESTKTKAERTVEFLDDTSKSFEDLLTLISNRITRDQLGVVVRHVNAIPIKMLYGKVRGNFDEITEKVKVVVQNK